MKWFALVALIFSLQTHAAVEEIELSSCFVARAPKRVLPVPTFPADQGRYWLDQLSVSYAYSKVQEVLVIVTNSYGQVVSEKVYKKREPVTETLTGQSGYRGTVDSFADVAFAHFTQRYDELMANACE